MPLTPGEVLRLVVEVEVERAGERRTLRRVAEIPVQPPLPRGLAASGAAWRAPAPLIGHVNDRSA